MFLTTIFFSFMKRIIYKFYYKFLQN